MTVEQEKREEDDEKIDVETINFLFMTGTWTYFHEFPTDTTIPPENIST